MIKVFHIGSGLGNQMLDYCDLLASRKMNPSDEFFIETIDYDCKQNRINMWNGYELEKVFGIKERNVKDLFSLKQWEQIMTDINESCFWDHGWNYSEEFLKAFSKQGLVLHSINEQTQGVSVKTDSKPKSISYGKYLIKRAAFKICPTYFIKQVSKPELLFRTTDTNDFNGSYRLFNKKGNEIERIEPEINAVFSFPDYDTRNGEFSAFLKSVNSVAIHARRGDLLGSNGYCYEFGFFKRAASFIKEKVSNPVFVFFCNTGSIEWCRSNLHIFGLDLNIDNIRFVDWNTGKYSFRDIQLMADCKHNIITESTFGWWGAYLNKNPNKITCSPDIRINTTHCF